jgi:tellurite resistance protein
MDLQEQIDTNKEIMRLIRSKYPEDFPDTYNTPEARYYERLKRDTEEAERLLELAK